MLRPVSLLGISAATTVLLLLGALLSGGAAAAEAPVGLGTAASYSVLGGSTVTNTGPTTLAGDLGVSPGTAITGFPPGIVGGTTHAADAAAAQAQSDVVVAYNDAASRALTASVAGDLVGQTLAPGVYRSSGPLAVSGALTLDAQGDPNAVFIFQIASTLTTASASNINVINGGDACRVYWQVGSSATLGTASTFRGTILALTSITATTGTVVHGRALARNGAVTLDTNTFTAPGCAAAAATATPTASATPTGGSSSTPTTGGEGSTTPPASGGGGSTTSPGDEDTVTSGSGGSGLAAGGGSTTGSPTDGSTQLAESGADSPQIGLGVLLVFLGGLLYVMGRARKPQGKG